MEDPMNSRIFVVCGKSVEADVLTKAFAPHGNVLSVKLVRDKGVAYVKYDKASSAAAAIEALHETVLNDGRGPMLKVMMAEAPTRRSGLIRPVGELQCAQDPDNVPPRSRLFMVVPKTAEGRAMEEEMANFRDFEYCKVDLIASKGIVFCKYSKTSSALLALETIMANDNMVAGYKVKCMIAEPKGKRGRIDPSSYDALLSANQLSVLEYGAHSAAYLQQMPLGNARVPNQSPAVSGNTMHSGNSEARSTTSNFNYTLTSGLTPNQALGTPNNLHARFNAAASNGDVGGYNPLGLANGLVDRHGVQEHAWVNCLGLEQLQTLAAKLGAANLAHGGGTMGGYIVHANGNGRATPQDLKNPSPESQKSHESLNITGMGPTAQLAAHNMTRLYVVVSKGVSEDVLTRLFRAFPGLEYCDLKRDHTTGQSRGFCYVKYSSPEIATAVIENLDGIEYPQGSGLRLKVMFAEPLHSNASGKGTPPLAHSRTVSLRSDSNSSILQRHRSLTCEEVTSASNEKMASEHRMEVAAVQNSLAHMSMPHQHEFSFDAPKTNGKDLIANGMEGDGEESAESTPTLMLPFPVIVPDECTLFTVLTRPLPDYALQHVFAQHGLVEWVHLRSDERYGVVRFTGAEGARRALEALHNTTILGEALLVTTADPLATLRNSKRPRVAE
ncbi:g6222 [Coccomyxa elongata]